MADIPSTNQLNAKIEEFLVRFIAETTSEYVHNNANSSDPMSTDEAVQFALYFRDLARRFIMQDPCLCDPLVKEIDLRNVLLERFEEPDDTQNSGISGLDRLTQIVQMSQGTLSLEHYAEKARHFLKNIDPMLEECLTSGWIRGLDDEEMARHIVPITDKRYAGSTLDQAIYRAKAMVALQKFEEQFWRFTDSFYQFEGTMDDLDSDGKKISPSMEELRSSVKGALKTCRGVLAKGGTVEKL